MCSNVMIQNRNPDICLPVIVTHPRFQTWCDHDDMPSPTCMPLHELSLFTNLEHAVPTAKVIIFMGSSAVLKRCGFIIHAAPKRGKPHSIGQRFHNYHGNEAAIRSLKCATALHTPRRWCWFVSGCFWLQIAWRPNLMSQPVAWVLSCKFRFGLSVKCRWAPGRYRCWLQVGAFNWFVSI